MWTRAPPSTGSATPVMKFASSEARNSAALATSQAVPILRRSGTRASRAAAPPARLLLMSSARCDGSERVERPFGEFVKHSVAAGKAQAHIVVQNIDAAPALPRRLDHR